MLAEIQAWKPLINKLAFRFRNTISSYDDLVNEGIVSLISAIDTYNPEKCNREGYIKTKIVAGIYKTAMESSFALSVPSGSVNHIRDKQGPHVLDEMRGEDSTALNFVPHSTSNFDPTI